MKSFNKAHLKGLALCVAGFVATAAMAGHVEETITLAKGWNAVCLETTPDDSICDNFFFDMPEVTSVSAYLGDAYAATEQYAEDGTEIVQKPISYRVWTRGDATASTLTALQGGRCYLIYATAAATKTFTGVPARPYIAWRATAGDDFMNLAGALISGGVTTTAAKYFGEGPAGKNCTVYQIGGTGDVPTFKSLGFLGASPKMVQGRAYAFSSTATREWPGVVELGSDAVVFGEKESRASVSLRNCGTLARTFQVSLVKSVLNDEKCPTLRRRLPKTTLVDDYEYADVTAGDSWEVTLDPNESQEQVFSLDRSKLAGGTTYAAVLQAEDLGGSGMRVRIPLRVETGDAAATFAFPKGLWAGQLKLLTVSRLSSRNQSLEEVASALAGEMEDPQLVAGGAMKLQVLVHVGDDGKVRLLRQAVVGVDANGQEHLWQRRDKVPADIAYLRQVTAPMMSVDTAEVLAKDSAGDAFGDHLTFDWVVGERARDNPFRHAWHPDHDGKTADYAAQLPSGDNLANYVNPVKPELWSMTNRLEFSWHEDADPLKKAVFECEPNETTSGYVTWTVGGLTAADRPITSKGIFALQRVIKTGRLEK